MLQIIKDSYAGLNSKCRDGSYLCAPTALKGKPIFFNQTVYKIFCLAKTCDSIIEVQEELRKCYPQVKKEKIDYDVYNTLWFLNNIGMVKIAGTEGMVLEEKKEVFMMASEPDFCNIAEYIRKKSMDRNCVRVIYEKTSIWDTDKVNALFTVANVRMEMMLNKTIYFKYSASDSARLNGILGISLSMNGVVAYINILVADSLKEGTLLLRKAVDYFSSKGIRRLKIKISRSDITKRIIDVFQQIGMEQEALLTEESTEGCDVIVFCKDVKG